jgi:hypothetical protein
MRPGPEVLACFGATAAPVALPGGQGTAWRAGDIVLKPAGDPQVAGRTSTSCWPALTSAGWSPR